jgi:hypothetical protein
MFFQLFSSITPPYPSTFQVPPDPTDAVVSLLNFILKIVFFAAGLYALWNVISAGYTMIGSGGDEKALESAKGKFIWTFIGLLVMIGAVVIAGIIGMIVYGDPTAIINPKFTNTP